MKAVSRTVYIAVPLKPGADLPPQGETWVYSDKPPYNKDVATPGYAVTCVGPDTYDACFLLDATRFYSVDKQDVPQAPGYVVSPHRVRGTRTADEVRAYVLGYYRTDSDFLCRCVPVEAK